MPVIARSPLNKCGRTYRSTRGALGSMLFLVGISIVLLLGFAAVDIAHFASANAEMHSISDAAALMGAYDLEWNSTASEVAQAAADARFLVQCSSVDLYGPGGGIPASCVTVKISSRNGGTDNSCTVKISPPIFSVLAPFLSFAGTAAITVSSTAARMPIAAGPAPPWFLETTDQGGPPCPSPLPSPAPFPPKTFPTSGYVTFANVQAGCAKIAPPVLPTYWVDLGITNLSSAKQNPNGIKSILACMRGCVSGTACTASNPIMIGGSVENAVHGAYNSTLSNPDANSTSWSNGAIVLLPVSTMGKIVAIYAVKLTGPYVANSFSTGQGVFGEFGVQFVARADNVPGVVAFDASPGAIYTNVDTTIAVLVD